MHTTDYDTDGNTHVKRIQRIAIWQRRLLVIVAIMVCIYIVTTFVRPIALFAPVIGIYCSFALYALMTACGFSRTGRIVAVCGLFLPVIQIVVLLIVNYHASEILRAAGLRSGTLGVSERDLQAFVDDSQEYHPRFTQTEPDFKSDTHYD